MSVNADLSKNTPVFSLQNELIQDKTAVQQILSVEFTRKAKMHGNMHASTDNTSVICHRYSYWNIDSSYRSFP